MHDAVTAWSALQGKNKGALPYGAFAIRGLVSGRGAYVRSVPWTPTLEHYRL